MVSKVLMFTSLKYFMLTTVAIFMNLEAFVTLLMGFYVLKEDVKCTDWAEIAITFISVIP